MQASGHPEQSAPRSVRGRAVVVVAALAAMVLVPAVALTRPRPAHLGWQMFSGQPTELHITVTLTNGRTERVEVTSLAARVRPELDLRRATVDWLCTTRDDVLSVHLRQSVPSTDREWPCERS